MKKGDTKTRVIIGYGMIALGLLLVGFFLIFQNNSFGVLSQDNVGDRMDVFQDEAGAFSQEIFPEHVFLDEIQKDFLYGVTFYEEESFPVIRVVDGDTFIVKIQGQEKTVRMIGIDTPETVHPRKTQECFGKESSDYLKNLLQDGSVYLVSDDTQDGIDKYGRLLRYVITEENVFINAHMIALGYAKEYTYQKPYAHQSLFRLLERDAQKNALGIWDQCANDFVLVESIPDDPLFLEHCMGNMYSCSDFSTWAEAQDLFLFCGGASRDIHVLDGDKNGVACEVLL
jgi:endonuclease YncB( thermonuclease family)